MIAIYFQQSAEGDVAPINSDEALKKSIKNTPSTGKDMCPIRCLK